MPSPRPRLPVADRVPDDTDRPGWIARLGRRWGLDSTWRILAVLLAFSLAGMSVVYARKGIWLLFRFTDDTETWIKVVTYLALVFPLYQLLLLAWGTLLGQFRFFWAKEKALVRWVLRRG